MTSLVSLARCGRQGRHERLEAAELGLQMDFIRKGWLQGHRLEMAGDDRGRAVQADSWSREARQKTGYPLSDSTMEMFKLFCPLCAWGQAGPASHRIAVVDIKGAYFYAPPRRPIFIIISLSKLIGDRLTTARTYRREGQLGLGCAPQHHS